MHGRMTSLLLAGAAICLFGFVPMAMAQDANSYKAMQSALKDLSYYKGKIDGQTGPATRAAMKAYADATGAKNEFWSIVGSIGGQLTSQVDWTPEMDEAVNNQLEGYLNDAQSARISDKMFFRTYHGSSACINVNAKNKLGAYVGYQWLYYAVVETPTFGGTKIAPVFIGPFPISDDARLTWCTLGYADNFSQP